MTHKLSLISHQRRTNLFKRTSQEVVAVRKMILTVMKRVDLVSLLSLNTVEASKQSATILTLKILSMMMKNSPVQGQFYFISAQTHHQI